MANPKKWEIWYANFDFEDRNESKDRPVLVIEIDGAYYVSSMITSHEQRGTWGDYDVTQWKTAGLNHPSTVRLSRLQNLELCDFRKKIGNLSFADIDAIERILR